MSHSFKAEGIVLKRTNYGEADRLVTIFTKERGKITATAKGVRKLTSKKRGSLEPASHAYFYILEHHGHFLITQTDLINSYQELQQNLTRITQVTQLLEIVNVLTVEAEEVPEIFTHLIHTLTLMKGEGNKKTMMLEQVSQLLYLLGFAETPITDEDSLKTLIESLTNRSLKSKKFLTVSPGRVE